jgi:integration host factor subunit alpha
VTTSGAGVASGKDKIKSYPIDNMRRFSRLIETHDDVWGGMELTKSVWSEKTITRQELGAAVYAAVSLPRKDAAAFVDEVIDEICDAIIRDGEVKLSNFGTFKVLSKNERMGRNPKTHLEHVISARKAVSFKPAAGLKRKINAGNEDTAE